MWKQCSLFNATRLRTWNQFNFKWKRNFKWKSSYLAAIWSKWVYRIQVLFHSFIVFCWNSREAKLFAYQSKSDTIKKLTIIEMIKFMIGQKIFPKLLWNCEIMSRSGIWFQWFNIENQQNENWKTPCIACTFIFVEVAILSAHTKMVLVGIPQLLMLHGWWICTHSYA